MRDQLGFAHTKMLLSFAYRTNLPLTIPSYICPTARTTEGGTMGVARHVAAVLLGMAISLGENVRQSAVALAQVPPREIVRTIDARPKAIVDFCVDYSAADGCWATDVQLVNGLTIIWGPRVRRQVAYKKPEEEGCLLSELLGPRATVNFSFNEKTFFIPAPYVNSFTRAPDEALIYAQWPSFGPLCGTKPVEGMDPAQMRGDLLMFIDNVLARLPLEERLERERRAIGPRIPAGSAFGLDREAPGPGASPYSPRILYIGRNHNTLNVFIDCSLGFVRDCRHIFVTAAGVLRVNYSSELLPHWQEIQTGILALFEHWERKEP